MVVLQFQVMNLEERFGNWDDLKSISKNHVLMADLVLNHVSSSHLWVQQFIKSQEPVYQMYILLNKDLIGRML